jgi:septal ring factor EnvC (AmiA/AmiB activator)
MPEGHRGARDAVLERDRGPCGARRPARAGGRARQLAARADQAPGRRVGCRHRGPERAHRRAAGLRARRGVEANAALLPGRRRGNRAPRRRRIRPGEGPGLKRALLALLVLAAALPAHANREQDLAALRARIEALRSGLGEKEADRREARDALRDSERAISKANRTLRALQAEGRAAQAALARLAGESRTLEARLARQQGALGRLLAARYAAGAPDALKIALTGEHPSDVARRLHYLAELSRATSRLAGELRAGLAQAEDLRRATEERRQRLAAIEAESREDRARIVAEQRKRRGILQTISVDIRKARRTLGTLQADEKRLARLVEEIVRVLKVRPGAGFARVEKVPLLGSLAGPFSGLRGKLRLPVRGELVGLFNAPREEGPAGRKGVFIRAPEGHPVLAVAAGQVVFADWMRGYGNLLIVDHGEAYLSIYANNESLLKQTGDPVAAGEAIATVGASGGNEHSGLYFELRHLGQAFDPLRWVVLK